MTNSIRAVLTLSFSLCAPGLSFHVEWESEAAGGFSAPNMIYRDDAPFLVMAERDTGLVCLDIRGNRVWNFPMTPPVSAAPAVAALNADRHDSIVAADGAGNLVALDGTGALLWRALNLLGWSL